MRFHCLLAILMLAVLGASGTDQPWYQRSLVSLEVGPTGSQFGSSTNDTGFATRFNGREIARAKMASRYVLPVPIEDAPMYRVTITHPDRLKSARAFNPDTKIQQRGQQAKLTVGDIHEVISLRY